MYRHFLVPIDGSELSVETVGKAVELAKALGASVTFFHARPDYGATSEGALQRTLMPEAFAEGAAGEARAILSKAEVAARAAGVVYDSVARTSDRPFEAIIEVAQERSCDLIFMASHGRRGIKGLMLGSQTQKVLQHTRIPVLVSAVESNVSTPEMNSAIAIIKDEHRSLAAVTHGLRYLVRQAREAGASPDFRLLRAALHYIGTFPETLHHPKEDVYLFRLLRSRSRETDEVITELQRQHVTGGQLFAALERALDGYEAGADGGLDTFAEALERFAEAEWEHMSVEEKVILPAAREHLTAEDWAGIARAFGENGDPRFGDEPDEQFRKLFSRILNLAPERVVGKPE